MKRWISKGIGACMLSAAIVAAGAGPAQAADHTPEAGVWQISIGNSGIGNGNQFYIVVQAPINVCGIGLGIVGLGVGAGTCTNGAWNNVDF
ncbi:hypothetical protein Lfu02_44320 [Longispora fulva]|uniref:Secreted protein n=1 Tax=Longispora fulva TaxID=619741 RepID=A0A8J7GQ50_9ACTN|nr:hypothetical protein [Longispora fulva]MBG6136889.1 hypothetical protein [Longispora fulva]GIG60060.1 hypothetical protein Lfu02_44320 [Longispora fulva]